MKRRAISFITVLALCLSLCPVQALAANGAKTMFTLPEDMDDTSTYVVSESLELDTQGYSYTISDDPAVRVDSKGALYLTYGRIESTKGAGIEVQAGGSLYVDQVGMTVAGKTCGLNIASGAAVELSGGTFTGGEAAIRVADGKYDALLVEGYAYFDQDGKPIVLFKADGSQDTAGITGAKTVTVKACENHVYAYKAKGGAPTHDGTCVYCGAEVTDVSCTFTFDANGNGKCTAAGCGHTLEITIFPTEEVYDGNLKPSSLSVKFKLDGSEITLTKDTDYTVDYTARKDVGEVIITVTIRPDNGTCKKIFSVTQAKPVITWEETDDPEWTTDDPITVNYDGEPVDDLPKVIINAKTDADKEELERLLKFYYKESTANDDAYIEGLPTDVGNYEIKACLPATTNYEAAESVPIILEIKIINPFKDDNDRPQAKGLTYDRSAQELVTPGTLDPRAVGAEILFALGTETEANEADFSETIPTATNAGTYYVWYKVVGTDNYNGVGPTLIAVTIERKEITPEVKLSYDTCIYDGGDKQPAVTVIDPEDQFVLPDSEYSVGYTNNRYAGTATVTVTDKTGGNYQITPENGVEAKFQITRADQDALTITNVPDDVTYGDVFTLVAVGGSGNGTVTWKIVSGNSATIDENSGQVTVTGVGTVTVRATKSGTMNDGNHEDATAEWTFTAGKRAVTAVVTADSKTYDGNATATVHAVVEQGVVSGDTITITGLTGTFEGDSGANAGKNKTVTVNTDNAKIKLNTNEEITNKSDAANEKYTVKFSAATVTADINKAAASVTVTTPKDLTYNRDEQALVTAATVSPASGAGQVEYSLYENGPWNTAIPTGTNAGDYEVWYRVQESTNYLGTAPAKVVVTIDPQTVEVSNTSDNPTNNFTLTPAAGDTYYVYDGTEKKPTITVKDKDSNVVPATEYTVTYSNNVTVGTNTAAVIITDNVGGNYTVSGTVKFTIAPADAGITGTPQAKDLTYNGQPQDLVTAGTASGGHLEYTLGTTNADGTISSGTYSKNIPQGTNAGEYTVCYKIVPDGNHGSETDTETVHIVYVTIQPKTVSSPVIQFVVGKADVEGGLEYKDTYSAEYTGGEHKPTVIVKDGDVIIVGTNEDGKTPEYTVTYSDNVNAGTATVHINDNYGGNYTVNGSKTFTIAKAAAKFKENEEPKAITGLTYTGKPQALITAGVPDGGTAVYAAAENGPYFPELPTGTDAGTYEVWAMVRGDANHTDSAPQKIKVSDTTEEITIAKSTIRGVELSSEQFRYNGSEQKPTVTVTDVNGNVIPANEYTVTYKSYDPTVSGTSEEGTAAPADTVNAGCYYVVVTSSERNYATFKKAVKVTIEPAKQDGLNITGQRDTVTYGDVFTLGTVGGSGSGAITWEIVDGETSADGTESVSTNAKINIKSGQVTVTGVGTVTVRATKSGTENGKGNREDATAEWTFTAEPKRVTAKVTAASKTYDGDANTTVTAVVEQGVVSGDIITITGLTGTFSGGESDSPNAGTGKTVTVDTSKAVITVNGVELNGATGEKYIVSIPGTATADIYKAAASVTVTTPTTLTYDRSPHSLVTEATVSPASGAGQVEYSLYENGPWNTAIPTGTNAGDYEVWYRVKESANYLGTAPAKVVVTIDPQTVEVSNTSDNPTNNFTLTPVAGDTYYVYDGTEKKPVVTVKDKDNKEIPATEYTVTYSNNVTVGEATVIITDNAGGNYKVNGTVTFTIKSADAGITGTPQAKDLTYNGQLQDLVTAGTAAGGHLEYALANKIENGILTPDSYDPASPPAADAYKPEIPQGKYAGTYAVYYRVKGDSNHGGSPSTASVVYVTIQPKTVSSPVITLSLPSGGFTYDGSEKTFDRTKNEITVYDGTELIPLTEYDVTYSDNVNAGTATVHINDNYGGNYTVNGSKTFTIAKAAAKFKENEEPKAITGLTYTGKPQALVTAGVPVGGTAVYSLNGGAYSAEFPTGTDAGSYTVCAKVLGDKNHEDSDPIRIGDDTGVITIDKKTVTDPKIELSSTRFRYNGSAQKPTVTVTDGKGYVIPAGEYTVTYTGDAIDAGTYTVKIESRDINYLFTSTDETKSAFEATFTIDPADQAAITITGTRAEVVYGDRIQLGITGGTGEGTVTWDVKSDKNSSDTDISSRISIRGGLLTVNTISGDDEIFTVTATRTSTSGNYNPVTAAWTFTVSKKAVTAVVIGVNKPYDGKTDATVKAEVTSGLVSGDSITISGLTGKFENENVGTNKTITVDSSKPTVTGTNSDKYDIIYPRTAAADITPKTVTPTVTLKVGPFTYTGNEIKPVDSVTWTDGTLSLQPTDYTVTYSDNINAGTATVTVRNVEGGNYSINATAQFTIAKANPTVTPPVGKTDLIYNGTAQELIYRGHTSGGTMVYSLVQNGTYSENIPTGTAANNNYIVYYKVLGDSNHKDHAGASVTAIIAKAEQNPLAISNIPSGVIHCGDQFTLTAIGGSGSGAVTWNIDENSDAATIAQDSGLVEVKGEGKVKITATKDGGTNYNDATATWTFTAVLNESDGDPGEEPEVSGSGGDSSGVSGGTTASKPSSGAQSTPSASKPSSAPSAAPEPDVPDEPAEAGPSIQTTERDGTASTVMNDAAGNELVDEAVANGSETIVIKPEITGGVTKTEVSIPASAVSRISSETDAALTVSTPVADVTIPNTALETLSGAGDTVSVTAERVKNTVTLTLAADGRELGDIPGGLTLTVSVENAGPGTVAVIIHEDGTRETVRRSVAGDGALRIPLNGSATVEIMEDNSKKFADVSPNSWKADAVTFASAHELFNGTGDTTFSPDKTMSRAMLVTVLYNLEGCPEQSLTDEFTDVSSDAWYAAGVAWAAANGITDGYGGGKFGPNDNVTREQLAVMLWRYVGKTAADEQVLNFEDADQASGYAMEALYWATANSILNGYGDGYLNPGGMATRAQAAQMLKNFIENT